MAASLQTTLGNVEALLEEREAAESLEEAWPEEQLPKATWEEPAGRFDGSELSLASGFGNLPLDLKLSACRRLGQLPTPVASQEAWKKELQQKLCSFRQAALQRSAKTSLDDSFAGSKATFSFAA